MILTSVMQHRKHLWHVRRICSNNLEIIYLIKFRILRDHTGQFINLVPLNHLSFHHPARP